MVPLNEAGLTYLDIFQMWDLPIVVVTRHYLGSINHTLLTLNALYQRELKIHALIINGPRLDSTERIYRAQFPEIKMHFIPEMEEITTSSISKAAEIWNEQQR
jgi:dethiobiotin synthetase